MSKKEPIDVVGEVAIMMLTDFQQDLIEFAEKWNSRCKEAESEEKEK